TDLPSTRILQSWLPLWSVQFNARYWPPFTVTGGDDQGSGTQVLVLAGYTGVPGSGMIENASPWPVIWKTTVCWGSAAAVGSRASGTAAAMAAAASSPARALGRGARDASQLAPGAVSATGL